MTAIGHLCNWRMEPRPSPWSTFFGEQPHSSHNPFEAYLGKVGSKPWLPVLSLLTVAQATFSIHRDTKILKIDLETKGKADDCDFDGQEWDLVTDAGEEGEVATVSTSSWKTLGGTQVLTSEGGRYTTAKTGEVCLKRILDQNADQMVTQKEFKAAFACGGADPYKVDGAPTDYESCGIDEKVDAASVHKYVHPIGREMPPLTTFCWPRLADANSNGEMTCGALRTLILGSPDPVNNTPTLTPPPTTTSRTSSLRGGAWNSITVPDFSDEGADRSSGIDLVGLSTRRTMNAGIEFTIQLCVRPRPFKGFWPGYQQGWWLLLIGYQGYWPL